MYSTTPHAPQTMQKNMVNVTSHTLNGFLISNSCCSYSRNRNNINNVSMLIKIYSFCAKLVYGQPDISITYSQKYIPLWISPDISNPLGSNGMLGQCGHTQHFSILYSMGF